MGFKKILITGARGMLGQELTLYLRAKGYEVFPSTSDQMSLLETEESLLQKLEPFQPEIIINCAAYTHVDNAERDPELAMAVNKDGARKLAQAARELRAILVHISTDYVFDGLKTEPYLPTDRPNPLNTYGLSKYYGELIISELLEEYYVIRTSWLYGIHRNNFVQWVLDNARAGNEIKAAEDWTGSPTWVGNLCVAIETLMNSGKYGTHHAADQGMMTRTEQARDICRLAGLSTGHIRSVTCAELNLAANRPKATALACPDLFVPSWETGFQAYLTQYMQTPQAS